MRPRLFDVVLEKEWVATHDAYHFRAKIPTLGIQKIARLDGRVFDRTLGDPIRPVVEALIDEARDTAARVLADAVAWPPLSDSGVA